MGFFDDLFDPDFMNPDGQGQNLDDFGFFEGFFNSGKESCGGSSSRQKPRQYDPDRDDNPDHEDDNDDW